MTGDIELVGDILERKYITTISFNSKNEVVQYCEADLLNTRNISIDNEILKI